MSQRTQLIRRGPGVLLVLLVALAVLTACSPRVSADRSPTPTPAAAAAAAPRQATVVMNGDLLWHNTLVFGAAEDARGGGDGADGENDADGANGADELDFAPLLAGVRPVVESADLAICHNEVPVAPPGGPYRYYPAFAAPQQTLDAVRKTGFDLCTTASNHSLDDGWPGLVRTLDAMETRGIRPVGTARTPAEADHPPIHTTAAGIRIAVVTGTYDTNGIPRPRGREWAVPDLDPDTLLRRAATARADGADIVLVAVHGGDEYDHQPNAQQRRLAELQTASDDVDLVYGHHVHVVQPWTKVNGKWVVYGLGNLVAQHKTDVPAGYEGVTARFTFTENPDGRFAVSAAEYLPTLVTRYRPGQPARLLIVNEALRAGLGDQQRLVTAQQRTRRVVHSLGGVDDLRES